MTSPKEDQQPMTTREELEPCPFCGLPMAQLREQHTKSRIFYTVLCNGCLAVGRETAHRSTAIEAWNTRASRQEVSVTVDNIKEIIRRELIDEQTCYELGTMVTRDVLAAGCAAVGYGVPTSPEVAADKFAELVARALLAKYSITKRTTEG
jgi:Lar family restriction alleviation protein